MSDSTPNMTQEMNQTLERTELGHVINDNKKSVIVFGIVILIAIIGFSFYQYQKNEKLETKLADTYSFQTKAVTPYLEGKMTIADFMASYEKAPSEILEAQAFLPLALKVSEKMAADKNNAEAINFLKAYYEKLSSTSFASYFLGVNYSAHLEDAGNTKEAISVLETAMKSSFTTLKDKVYFDLGRLYLASGNNEKAKEMFEYVNKNFSDTEYAKLATLYLNGMTK